MSEPPDHAQPTDAGASRAVGSAPPNEGSFRQLGESELWRGYLLRLVEARFADPAGQEFAREIVRHPGAVAVVAVDDAGRAILVRQYRGAQGKSMLEIPAGTCDVDGEPLEETARRELAEEAGILATDLIRLAAVTNAPGYSDQVTTIFLATGLSPCPVDRSGIEEHWMTVEPVPLDEVERLTADGSLVDATSLLGLRLAKEQLASAPPVSERRVQEPSVSEHQVKERPAR